MKLRIAIVVTMALAYSLPTPCCAGSAAEEYRVKAGFIYNITQFVEWPAQSFADDAAPFVIGIFGSNPFGAELEALRAKRVKGHAIQIVTIPEKTADLPACHILFIPVKFQDQVARLLKQVKDRPVVTMGECKEFARQGGVVNFFIQNDRVGFEINMTSARSKNLDISSRLLKLARIVEDASP